MKVESYLTILTSLLVSKLDSLISSYRERSPRENGSSSTSHHVVLKKGGELKMASDEFHLRS